MKKDLYSFLLKKHYQLPSNWFDMNTEAFRKEIIYISNENELINILANYNDERVRKVMLRLANKGHIRK